ncbi:MAG: PatA/PatG family cyanobactin maturation protease [Cyanobacteria bacterium P01_F01_bin.150]
MPVYPFAVSLNSTIQVSTNDNGYILSHGGSDRPSPGEAAPNHGFMLTLPAATGMGDILAQLQEGNATTDALVQALSQRDGTATGEEFAVTLQQLDQRGWLNYSVLPLATAIPMVETAQLNLTAPHWSNAEVCLSRFAYQHSHKGAMVLESPLSKYRVKLLDWRASAVLAQLAQPQSLRQLTPPPQIGPETAYQFLNLLWATGFLTVEAESTALKLWDFHNLLFHSRSRQGRHDYPTGDIEGSLDIWSDFPVVKPPMSGQIVPLPQLSIDAIRQHDKTLTTAIEKRESIREYDDHHPITIDQLSELLYRTARVKEIYTLDTDQAELLKQQFGPDFEWGDLTRRPYPCGGAMYELEIYPVVRRCNGVNPGLYHYDPLNHHLAQLDASDADISALITDAHQSSGEQGIPQVLLVITARFGRLFRKYRSLAYALVLKHVGVLYQNLYLVATNMGLAPRSLGAGDSDRFAQATGLDYIVESSVGEFMLGSLPNSKVEASGQGSRGAGEQGSRGAGEADIKNGEVQVSDSTVDLIDGDDAIPVGVNVGMSEEVEAIAIATPSAPLPLCPSAPVEFPSSTQPTAITPSAPPPPSPPVSPSPHPPVPQHPHDLDDRIPGLSDLRDRTLGDPRITLVILDGNPDHSLSCFQGGNISKVFPYWHEKTEPVAVEDYLKYQEIDNNDNLEKDEKAEVLKATFSEATLKRIRGDNHACHITSTMVGQENTPSPGLAPNCTAINVPLNTTGEDEEFISPLNLARAFELALDLGANIIHCAACRPTQTGEGEELLMQALKKCQDNNILIVAPAGNNKGECWCMPASLPGVLSVGALKPDGTPYKFSNWGGNNELEGIMAPGGEILGAQPANEDPVRLKGTSMSAPVMSGLCALLMSLQLQEGKPVDAEAIRMALLNTAIPCTAEDTAEPERCLRGKVNLPGAMGILFGESVTVSFAGDQVVRTQRRGEWGTGGLGDWGTGGLGDWETGRGGAEGIAPAVSASVGFRASTQPTVTPSSPHPLVPSSPRPASAPPPLRPSASPSTITPSTAHSGHVYALGTLNYDFGDETRRDSFKQLMAPVELNGVMVPPDPYDVQQMIEHLDRHPEEGKSLIWTLSLDQNTVYALDPKGPFAADIYEMFLLMLNGQQQPPTSLEFVERISVPARRTNRTVELFSGEIVPVVTVRNVRGMYGWTVNALVESALASVLDREETDAEVDENLLRQALTSFLNRVYNDLHNVGQLSRDRALNFATTNIFQATTTFAEAIANERQLDTIEVEKSPFCRMNSDCWDVKLTFFDPENGRRSRKVYRFTIDVADQLPVTVGKIKFWSIPSKSQ